MSRLEGRGRNNQQKSQRGCYLVMIIILKLLFMDNLNRITVQDRSLSLSKMLFVKYSALAETSLNSLTSASKMKLFHGKK